MTQTQMAPALDAHFVQIRFCGFGGQGVVLAAEILGHAAMLWGRWAAQSSAYGAEARGGASSSEVIISDSWIAYPKVEEADVLVAMSQNGYNQHIFQLRPQGLVLFDSSLVVLGEGAFERSVLEQSENLAQASREQHYAIPATQVAQEKLGNSLVANMIMLGALVEITNIVPKDKLIQAIKTRIAPSFFQVNLRALELGCELGRKACSR